MNRGGLVGLAIASLVVLGLVVVSVPGQASSEELGEAPPAPYPGPVVDVVEQMLVDAREDTLPNGTHSPKAAEHLEDAQASLEEGFVRSAIDALVLFRAQHETDRLAVQVEGASARDGSEEVQQARSELVEEAQARAEAARAVVSQVDVANLTREGAETGIWASVLIARAEYRLNALHMLPSIDAYSGQEFREDRVYQGIAPVVSAGTFARAGASIAAVAPSVEGTEEGAVVERVERVANATLRVPGGAQIQEYLPDAGADASSLLRAGFTVHAVQELDAVERERLLQANEERGDVSELAEGWIAFARGELRPWAAGGSPLALAAFEGVRGFHVEGRSLDSPGWSSVVRAQTYALAVVDAQKALREDVGEGNPAPLPSALAVSVSVIVTALMVAGGRLQPRREMR